MDELIKMAVSQLGLDESKIKTAIGGVLKFIKDQLSDADFSQITDKLPEANALVNQAPAAAGAGGDGGGMLGSLLSKASSMLGGNAGAALDLASVLKNSGMSLEQGGSLLTMLIEFLKNNLGDDLVAKITSALPNLGGSK